MSPHINIFLFGYQLSELNSRTEFLQNTYSSCNLNMNEQISFLLKMGLQAIHISLYINISEKCDNPSLGVDGFLFPTQGTMCPYDRADLMSNSRGCFQE